MGRKPKYATEEERKAAQREYNKRYFQAHKEEIHQQRNEYYATHKEAAEKKKEYNRVYQKEHREATVKKRKETEKKEKRREYYREYYQTHKAQMDANAKKWMREHPESRRAYYVKNREYYLAKSREYYNKLKTGKDTENNGDNL